MCLCLAIIVHQESVCATFGSGLSSACVVDVGDQKTSVCCVEDGVSHRNSRWGSSHKIPRTRSQISKLKNLLCCLAFSTVCICGLFCLAFGLQVVFGIRWLRCDPSFLLAPAEGRVSLQGLSAAQQTRLSAAAASERDILPSKSSACWSSGSFWRDISSTLIIFKVVFALMVFFFILNRTYQDYKIMNFRPVSQKPQLFCTRFALGMKNYRCLFQTVM